MFRKAVSVAGIAAIMGLIAVAGADARGAGQRPCRADRLRLCPESPPGKKARPCLKKHWNDLSPACQAKFEKKKHGHTRKRFSMTSRAF